jgi:bleomycin hydrolase
MNMPRPLAAFLLGAALVCPTLAQSALPRGPDDFRTEVELERTPVLSQGRTGTCWSFATTSFLESEVLRLHGERVDLSEIHTVYWGYVEKALRFVRLHGKAQFSEG